ncbi:putative oxidoreductase C-terminal domain-containing protein [Adhaeribacter rhizoryzae]|uniref:Oxidoreductase n=1 Tax=Adhaeribacter rhizoryzae TaxID=2607907 RepID=A0A5M6DA91_9BACT|nr:putative oxidoreductase C-terminal domain-containing protein [Adhaeribacter rhizoryzae]KAA5543436.1 oxidoreductase [Adhaeribacter rhizoryzae]
MFKNLATVTLPGLALCLLFSCSSKKNTANSETASTDSEATAGSIKLITLDPGHFHAALVQKTMLSQVDPTVHVYAPAGEDVQEHLKKIEAYNNRPEDPTQWKETVYTGPDYLQKLVAEKKGNVVVMAGNNARKTEYIKTAVEAGFNVLADKPMAINTQDFTQLKEAFATAKEKNILLYDIMTERFEITTMLQREFSQLPEVFGELQKGTAADPAITKESVHHFFKYVSGAPIKRPAWFFDVTQQGEGIVDVTTHLVDLVQWECYPEQIIDYNKDITINSARHWKTTLSPSQFKKVTSLTSYPEFLQEGVEKDSMLGVYANGEINYQLKGTHAKVSVIWNYEAPEGAGDTHFSIMKGTKANLVIRQGKEQNYKPQLYIEPAKGTDLKAFETSLKNSLAKIQANYPGVEVKQFKDGWQVEVPEKYHNGHEAHFGQVMERYLKYVGEGKLPEWEVPNMLAKYYTTTKALEMARGAK